MLIPTESLGFHGHIFRRFFCAVGRLQGGRKLIASRMKRLCCTPVLFGMGRYIICLLSLASLVLAESPAGGSAAGFKIRDCQFRLFMEQESFWLEYERSTSRPQIYFARLNAKQNLIEIGLNCLVRIKPKVIKINHQKFPTLKVQSDGTTFRISIKTTGVPESPRILDDDPKDNIIQVMLLSPKVDQATVNAEGESEDLAEQTSDSKNGASDNSAAEIAPKPDLGTTEEFLQAEGKVLLPQPDMLDRLTSEKLANSKPTDKSPTGKPSTDKPTAKPASVDKPSPVDQTVKEADSKVNQPNKPTLDSSSGRDLKNGNSLSNEQVSANQAAETDSISKDFDANDSALSRDSLDESQVPNVDEWGHETTPSYQRLDTDIRLIFLVFGLLVFCSAILVLWYRAKFGGRQRARQQLFGDSPGPSDLSPYYALLGVRGSDSNDAIKKRYKHLIKVFHADKLSAQDLPEEMVSLANERFQQIQDAYEKIKTVRGF